MHDNKGRELKEGDVVLVPMKLTGVYGAEGYCNVSAESVYDRKPDGSGKDTFSFNANTTLRANKEDENDFSDLYPVVEAPGEDAAGEDQQGEDAQGEDAAGDEAQKEGE